MLLFLVCMHSLQAIMGSIKIRLLMSQFTPRQVCTQKKLCKHKFFLPTKNNIVIRKCSKLLHLIKFKKEYSFRNVKKVAKKDASFLELTNSREKVTKICIKL